MKFLKKVKNKIVVAFIEIAIFLIKSVSRFLRFTFTKRKILFVTNQGIRTITLGPIVQISIIFAISWTISVFFDSLKYHEIITAKSEEIEKLKSVNSYFEEELTSINDKLKKVNQYFISITGSTHNVSSEEYQFRKPESFQEEDLSKKDKHTFNQLKDADLQLANIEIAAVERIKKIEKIISITGLNIKKEQKTSYQVKDFKKESVREVSLNEDQSKITSRQGGPLSSINSLDSIMSSKKLAYSDDIEIKLKKAKFLSRIDRLTMLEKLIGVLPFARPMKNYYISSGFGTRTDPITGRFASHQGLDFVGPQRAKVISPSKGKIILAGKFSDYGNAIVIDHGFGITTRYGHLAEVKVKEGQIVKRGDLIAIQGSTGRSTGAHLHYEVRYKNSPLNPRKFLEAGDSLFNDSQRIKYVNS
jgi:murein DD-endopeptidase MepM/ murein hydrolase activator NlpD